VPCAGDSSRHVTGWRGTLYHASFRTDGVIETLEGGALGTTNCRCASPLAEDPARRTLRELASEGAVGLVQRSTAAPCQFRRQGPFVNTIRIANADQVENGPASRLVLISHGQLVIMDGRAPPFSSG